MTILLLNPLLFPIPEKNLHLIETKRGLYKEWTRGPPSQLLGALRTLSNLHDSSNEWRLSWIHTIIYRWNKSLALTPPFTGLEPTGKKRKEKRFEYKIMTNTTIATTTAVGCLDSYLIFQLVRSFWKSAVAIMSSATWGEGPDGGHATRNACNLPASSVLYMEEDKFGRSTKLQEKKHQY